MEVEGSNAGGMEIEGAELAGSEVEVEIEGVEGEDSVKIEGLDP